VLHCRHYGKLLRQLKSEWRAGADLTFPRKSSVSDAFSHRAAVETSARIVLRFDQCYLFSNPGMLAYAIILNRTSHHTSQFLCRQGGPVGGVEKMGS
jgi:hypothetical protein